MTLRVGHLAWDHVYQGSDFLHWLETLFSSGAAWSWRLQIADTRLLAWCHAACFPVPLSVCTLAYNSSVCCPCDPIPLLVAVFILSGTGQKCAELILRQAQHTSEVLVCSLFTQCAGASPNYKIYREVASCFCFLHVRISDVPNRKIHQKQHLGLIVLCRKER